MIEASIAERDRRIEQEFLERSRAEQARRREYNTRIGLFAVIGVAVIFFVMTGYALLAQHKAESERDAAEKARASAKYQQELAQTESDRNRTARDQSEQARQKLQDAVNELRSQLLKLSTDMSATPASDALRRELAQVQTNIDRQLGILRDATAEPPRVYIHF